MKKSMKSLVLVAIFGAAMFTEVYAQRGAGKGPNSDHTMMYDLSTVETITGEIVNIEKIPGKMVKYGIHLMVKTPKETISVHLGPDWYIENQEEKLESGDKVTIKGSRITYEEKPAIIAAEVKRGEDTLILRDENGYPLWRGWRRKM
jgi:hypothetical protein